jgi:hypothetical protein
VRAASGRPLGIAIALSGVAIAAVAFLPWYSASAPGRRETASGVAAAGEIWSLPVIGALILIAGALLAVDGSPAGSAPSRRAGAVALCGGALAAVWAVKNGIDVPVTPVPNAGGGALAVPVDIEPALFGAAAASACAFLAGLLALRPEIPWP